MSNASKTGQNAAAANKSPRQEHASSARNLRGLMPYLGRYRPAIALGMLALALTSIIGNIIPLAPLKPTSTRKRSPAAGSAGLSPFTTRTAATRSASTASSWLSAFC